MDTTKEDSTLSAEFQRKVDAFVHENVNVNVSHLVGELCYMPEYSDDLGEVMVKCDENDEDDYIEALEHWSVSNRFAEELLESGEMVVEFMGLNIWGRTTSGQAISMDQQVVDIFRKLRGAK